MAARYGALSVDHIEYLDEAGVMAIAKSGTVAVLLPGAFYYLREKQAPPVAQLRAHHACRSRLRPISIPAPRPSIRCSTTMNMACVLFGLTPEEALLGVTANAARALGLADRGTHRTRPAAPIWRCGTSSGPGDLAYPLGRQPAAPA